MDKIEQFTDTRCRIRAGWEGAGRVGDLHAIIEINDQRWAVIVFDVDDDPEMYKALGIEVERRVWAVL